MSAEKSKQKLSDRYSSNGNGTSSPKMPFFTKPVAIAAVITVLAVGGTIAIVSLSGTGSGKESASPVQYNMVVAPDDIDKQLEERSETVAPGSYDVCMNTDWTFADARSSSSNAYVQNLTTNTNNVYFEVTRNDNGAKLYQSPVIPVGSSLRNIKLEDESLPRGTYPCTLVYHLVDSDNNNISHLNINIKIIIENN